MNIDRYRVQHEDGSALKRVDPDDTGRFKDKASALAHLEAGVEKLDALQERLYASDRYALLLIFQGMDAAGKDSAIEHVLSGLNPQGTEVRAFKQPSGEELAHDFLWRAAGALPARGRIGIFNRSYYEDVVVVRVHPELIGARRLPEALLTEHWKFSMGDLVERDHWKRYRSAYADALAATSHARAPWYVVPADHKWFAHAVIAEVIVQTLESLDLSLPRLTPRQRRELSSARRILKRR